MPRKRKSVEQHKLEGTYRKYAHDRRAASVPQFPPADGTPPRYLSRTGRAEWIRLAPLLLESGLLQATDVSLLASYCEAYAGFRDCIDDIKRNGRVIWVESTTRTGMTRKPVHNPAVRQMGEYQRTMATLSAKFGFSAGDREKIAGTALNGKQDEPDDPLEAFIREGEEIDREYAARHASLDAIPAEAQTLAAYSC